MWTRRTDNTYSVRIEPKTRKQIARKIAAMNLRVLTPASAKNAGNPAK